MGLTLLQVMPVAWGGGMEKQVIWVADEAARRGWRSIVAYWGESEPVGSVCEYVRLPSGGIGRGWPAALGRLVRRVHPDLVHLHDPQAGALGAVVLWMQGFRGIVYSDHSVPEFWARKHRAGRIVTARIPVANVGLSDAVVASMVRDTHVPRERVQMIRPGVEEAAPLGPPDEHERRFVCVANFWPWKGHLDLLRALAMLDRDPPVTLTLFGDGVERPRIEAEILRLGLSGRVSLMGFVADPWAQAEGAWGYVHPSHHEGGPQAVMEAMVRGLPVVATASGGTPELVPHDRSGLLVPPHDPAALAAAIDRLAFDAELRERLGRAGRADALSHHRWQDFIDEMFEFYARNLTHTVSGTTGDPS